MAEDISWMHGMFVGLLDESEVAAADQAVRDGLGRYTYEGAGGFMGLAKFRVNAVDAAEPPKEDVCPEHGYAMPCGYCATYGLPPEPPKE